MVIKAKKNEFCISPIHQTLLAKHIVDFIQRITVDNKLTDVDLISMAICQYARKNNE